MDTPNGNDPRDPSDIQFSNIHENGTDIKIPARNLIVSRISASVANELSRNTSDHSLERNHYNYQPMGADPYDRQLSLIDPLSDRVTTVLVWQNLTVTSYEGKNQELMKKIKSCNRYVPKRKCLLNNISGAITGGLWAVMGT